MTPEQFFKFDQQFDVEALSPSYLDDKAQAERINREFGLTDYERNLFIFWL